MGDDDGPTASIILFLVLILVDVFFYGFGAAVQSINPKDIEKKADENKDKRAKRLLHIIHNPSRYINLVQLITTLSNVIMGGWYLKLFISQVNKIMEDIGVKAIEIVILLLAMAFLLYVVLTFGVLLPKKLASRFPEKWAYSCVSSVCFMMALFRPLTGLISLSVSGILKFLGLLQNEDNSDVTEEVILSMVNEGHEQGVIEASEAEMITNIFEYGDKEAQDIMTQRSNIVAIEGTQTLSDAIKFMLSEKNSRFPVYEENMDHIIGILHLKDALRMQSIGVDVEQPVKEVCGLLRQAKFIPLTRNIDDLFKAMQSQKLQMVIVVDEYGQTAGLIAMEDILEEIVGNILDEYDEEESFIEEKGDDQYVIDGKTPLEELEERFKISFDQEEFETLNGFMIFKMEHIPKENEQFDIDVGGFNFKVLSVENKMIQSVLVTRIVQEEQKDEQLEVIEEND